MSDNIVQFPGTTPEEQGSDVTPDTIITAAAGRYSELVLIGKNKETGNYECVSSMDIPETLYHVARIQHRLNLFLDGE